MTRFALRLSVCGALALSLPGAGSALAQGNSPMLRGHDTNAPVDFSADRIELQDRADRVLLTGNVAVRQGDMTMSAARMTVAYTRAGTTDVNRLDASGGVVVNSPTQTARGSIAIYDLDHRLITMLGGVTLTQGANVVRGARLVIDLDSGRASVDGSPVAGNAAQAGGRVTGRFTVPPRNKATATP
jgi:lipopolysaccharide export system protein LptA